MKKLLIVSAILLSAAVSRAQQAPPDKEIILKLPLTQINLVLAHLAEGKLKDTYDVVTSIRLQTLQQLQAADSAARKPDSTQKPIQKNRPKDKQ